jgi:DNA-binding NtrC family response regulator
VGEGTLFLDEVDTLPLATQAKLLRALDQKVFEPVGSNTSKQLKCRIITATNASLQTKIDAGQFRADLYYRLKVVELMLPPLRDAIEEIRPLVEYHAARLAREFGQAAPQLAPRIFPILESHYWPGNVRELINTVEQILTFCESDVISVDDLPEVFQALASTIPEVPMPAEIEMKPLERARNSGEFQELVGTLKQSGNNRTLAARILGISRVSLYKKLHKYGLIQVQK